MTDERPPLLLVGCGNMGGAMLRGWLADGWPASRIQVLDPVAPSPAADIALCRHAADVPPVVGRTIILAIKPQALAAVAPDIEPLVTADTTLISILAGVEMGSLSCHFPRASAIIRVMPNTPAAIGCGVMAMYTTAHDPALRGAAERLMRPLGLVEWIDREELFDAVTALSGCGPAFVFRFIDGLAAAGAALGLPADQALRLALATVDGSAALAAGADEPPAMLADRVASPGGSTRKGLDRLDQDGDLFRLLRDTLDAAAKRNAEMAAEARSTSG